MDPTHYHFRTSWSLPASPAAVFEALELAEEYPRWWPQVREVHRVDDTSGVITVRSVLPYALTFTAREVRRDAGNGVLQIALCGDLDGWASWTVGHDGDGSLARYEQVVEVNKPLLRRLALPGRPVFRANHRWMMRCGRRGLTRYLAGGRQAV